jgi:hypothetical protein
VATATAGAIAGTLKAANAAITWIAVVAAKVTAGLGRSTAGARSGVGLRAACIVLPALYWSNDTERLAYALIASAGMEDTMNGRNVDCKRVTVSESAARHVGVDVHQVNYPHKTTS